MSRRYRVLKDPMGSSINLVLTATDTMMEDFKYEIERWIEHGVIEWVENENG